MSLTEVNIFQKRLAVETAIAEYLDLAQSASNRKLGAAKGKITKLANELGEEIGAVAARERISVFLESVGIKSDRLNLLKKRFIPNSFYEEGERIFGWWDVNSQVLAEALPLCTEIHWETGKAYIVPGPRRCRGGVVIALVVSVPLNRISPSTPRELAI